MQIPDRELENKYLGETIFIIGNGPSLKDIDMHMLKDRYTFSFNRAYIVYDEWGFFPSFYTCLDKVVLPDNVNELNQIIPSEKASRTQFFFPDWIEDRMNANHNVLFYPSDLSVGRNFNASIDPLTMLLNVGSTSIQIAVWMGFRKIVLLGCDCNYVEKPENVKINHSESKRVGWTAYTSESDDDPNHFIPNYFGTGKNYSIPCAAWHLKGWQMVHKWIETYNSLHSDPIAIFNVSEKSKITFFKKVSFEHSLRAETELQAVTKEKKKIIVYGASASAREFLRSFGTDYSVSYFVDSDPQKWGKTLFRIPIKNPAVLRDEETISAIVVAVQCNYEAIKSMIGEMGYAGDIKHFSFRQEEKENEAIACN